MFSFLQLNLTAGEEVEIDYEVDGWFYVSTVEEGIRKTKTNVPLLSQL